jgi:hypothetical protein
MIVGGHSKDFSKIRFNFLSLGDPTDATIRLSKPLTEANVIAGKPLEDTWRTANKRRLEEGDHLSVLIPADAAICD